ncbi:chymotrypsin family serine protease [Actinophytocola sp. KF-1]
MSARRRRAALPAAVLAAGLLIAAPGAHADGVAPAVTAADLSLQQRPLVEAAERLQAVVDRGEHPGFAGIVLADKEVTVWWKGPVPRPVASAVARVSRDVPVRVARAAYSRTEIAAAAADARAWMDAHPGAGVYGVKSPGDGSGLVLAAYPGAATRAADVAALRAVTGVPVTVRAEAPMTDVSRQDDAPPWWGGARTWNQTESTLCTSGFGVRDGANRRYLLTAEHCGQVGSRIADGKGEYIGTTSRGHDDHDIGLIPANSDNYMYVGGGDSNTGARVTGWGHVFVGQYLCQSGVTSAEATGGPVCNLKVIFFWQDAEDLVEAEHTQGQQAARGGDSGGSVYSTASGGVVANGTVTRAAGARLGFQDFATANRDFGVTIP